MAQPLRMFSALKDNWGVVPRTHGRVLIPPARGDLMLLPHTGICTHVYTPPHRRGHMHIIEEE